MYKLEHPIPTIIETNNNESYEGIPFKIENDMLYVNQDEQIIEKANREYYLEDNPTLTDQEYDRYMGELISLENRYPKLKRKDSPTVHVGTKVQDKFNKVTHKISMLSLGNVFNEDEVRLFDERIQKEDNNYLPLLSSI